jgi:F-type H+-transporting ATPase subunit delta
MISGVAGRYASALFDVARDENAMDAIGTELERFDALVRESRSAAAPAQPAFTADEQKNAIGAILDRAGISGLGANFIASSPPSGACSPCRT